MRALVSVHVRGAREVERKSTGWGGRHAVAAPRPPPRLHPPPPSQDALAESDKITLEVARLIKDDFLQQNSYTK